MTPDMKAMAATIYVQQVHTVQQVPEAQNRVEQVNIPQPVLPVVQPAHQDIKLAGPQHHKMAVWGRLLNRGLRLTRQLKRDVPHVHYLPVHREHARIIKTMREQ